MIIKRFAFILTLFLLSGCAQLPEYAKPRFHLSYDDGVPREGFTYRELRVEDFQAESLEGGTTESNNHINARSCIDIRPTKTLQLFVASSLYHGHSFYAGSVSGAAFEAVFIPDCSWWNPKVPKSRTAYVLQHEQIHFALSELTARRLTRQAQEEMSRFVAFGESYVEVKKDLTQALGSLAEKTMKEDLQSHTEFDEETSMFYDPEEQQSWHERVEQQLVQMAEP